MTRWPSLSVALFVAASAGAALPVHPVAAQIDAPYVPTPDSVVAAMLELAGVTAADTVLDLGSGDGRLVLAAAERGAAGVGIELRQDLVERSRAAARRRGLDHRVRFVNGDILDVAWGRPTVVLLYLSPALLRVLAPRLRTELPPGTRVVSHAFGFPGWEPEETRYVPGRGGRKTPLHVWVIESREERPGETRGDPMADSGGVSRFTR